METNKKTGFFPRKKFWIYFIVSWLAVSLLEILLEMMVGHQMAMYIYVPLAAYWIYIEVQRFHDANKSGWLALMNIFPGIGIFAAVIVAGVMPSNYENNKWYPNAENSDNDAKEQE